MAELAQGLGMGFVRPLLTPAHLLALIGLGLLLARQANRGVLLAVFALSLAAGLGALAAAVGATPARNVLLGCAALAGVGVAAAFDAPRLVMAMLAAAIGIAIGLDSPPETTSIAVGNAMLAGTWLGTCLCVALVIAGTIRLRRGWQQLALRIVGSWIAASAILALALRIFR
jgi:urease accessory protein